MRFIKQKHVFERLMQDVTTLFIDFDDTLVGYDDTKNNALRKFFSKFKLHDQWFAEFNKEFTRINDQLWPQLEQGKLTIDDIRHKRFQYMKNLYPLNESPLELDAAYLEYFIDATEINQKIMENLQAIKELGLRIFILTNGIKKVQGRRMQKIGLLEVIEGYLTSEDVGKAKPHPLMFSQAMAKLQVKPENCLMIGDSLSSDILGAINSKILSCHIYPHSIDQTLYDDITPDMVSTDFNKFSEYFIQFKINNHS